MKAVFSQQLDDAASTRRVVKVTVRHSDAQGQLFLEPTISIEGWLTSLSLDVADDATVIKLYKEHALCEQFHSEFKTDLDLERLPSGKFATNDLAMGFAVMAYNILRWVSLRGLMQSDFLFSHSTIHRRLKTVMQELMYLACRLVKSGRQLTLKLGSHCPGFSVFNRVYHTT